MESEVSGGPVAKSLHQYAVFRREKKHVAFEIVGKRGQKTYSIARVRLFSY